VKEPNGKVGRSTAVESTTKTTADVARAAEVRTGISKIISLGDSQVRT
jgi:hypothetical protein